MDEVEVSGDEAAPVRRRRSRLKLALGGLVTLFGVVLIAAVVILWLLRVRIATDFIDRELARRGVQATYDVKRIGPGTQVFENLVLGDPRRPDLIARRVEVKVLVGIDGLRVGTITARGVRVRGRLTGGRVTFGQLDRLSPPRRGDQPFRLPNQRIDVADAGLILDTPAGRVEAALEGSGNLAFDFAGRLAVRAPALRLGDCRLPQARALLAVAIEDERPRLRGPVALPLIDCGRRLQVRRAALRVEAGLDRSFARWQGEARADVARLATGDQALQALSGRLTFAGDAGRTAGGLSLSSGDARLGGYDLDATRFSGRYAVAPDSGALELRGRLGADGAVFPADQLASVTGIFRALRGTPVTRIGEALARAVERAGRAGSNLTADLTLLSNARGQGAVRLQRLDVASRSGARLIGVEGRGITYDWRSGALQTDGRFALSGGGLPPSRFVLSQARPGAAISGVGQVSAMRLGDERLALGPIRFGTGPGGTRRLDTIVEASGPFAAGRVERLRLPLQGRFGRNTLLINTACTPARFQRLELGAFRFGAAGVTLCPVGPALVYRDRSGRVRVAADFRRPRLAGTIGGAALALASDRLRFDVNAMTFDAGSLVARIGPADGGVRLSAASFGGRILPRGNLAGRFSGLAGDILAVPLNITDAAGTWSLDRGVLALNGGLTVSDKVDPARFNPLVSRDFAFRLADNRITAEGWLQHPESGTNVTRATIRHDLGTGAGDALLAVPGLTFAGHFQPDDLTRLTTGVVALVEGTIMGEGRIAWDGQGTRSSGTFSTAGANLAAPFGPVQGLTTTVTFTDLLGLTSAPGQVATVDLIQAGIDVPDGRVTYQLLPNNQVQVESGLWPFAGGELILQPTLLDFSRESDKRLTFRVVGLDAARFVQQMEFGNLNVTGIFDGTIPMIFDQSGGRIVGGELAARSPGGTLAYVGELTDRDLGTYGKLAFDALRSLRYSAFTINVDGSLTGEFLTRVRLDGIARDPQLGAPAGGGIAGIVARRALSQLARIPFRFNIRIQGPFRAVIGTARSFDDPSLLIQPVLPRVLRDLPTTVTTTRNPAPAPATPVQNEESEPVR